MNKEHETLARYLCASFVAYKLGITLAYALKAHVGEDKLADFWYQSAANLVEALTDSQPSLLKEEIPDNIIPFKS